jgi:hypothetical protein
MRRDGSLVIKGRFRMARTHHICRIMLKTKVTLRRTTPADLIFGSVVFKMMLSQLLYQIVSATNSTRSMLVARMTGMLLHCFCNMQEKITLSS